MPECHFGSFCGPLDFPVRGTSRILLDVLPLISANSHLSAGRAASLTQLCSLVGLTSKFLPLYMLSVQCCIFSCQCGRLRSMLPLVVSLSLQHRNFRTVFHNYMVGPQFMFFGTSLRRSTAYRHFVLFSRVADTRFRLAFAIIRKCRRSMTRILALSTACCLMLCNSLLIMGFFCF